MPSTFDLVATGGLPRRYRVELGYGYNHMPAQTQGTGESPTFRLAAPVGGSVQPGRFYFQPAGPTLSIPIRPPVTSPGASTVSGVTQALNKPATVPLRSAPSAVARAKAEVVKVERAAAAKAQAERSEARSGSVSPDRSSNGGSHTLELLAAVAALWAFAFRK